MILSMNVFQVTYIIHDVGGVYTNNNSHNSEVENPYSLSVQNLQINLHKEEVKTV